MLRALARLVDNGPRRDRAQVEELAEGDVIARADACPRLSAHTAHLSVRQRPVPVTWVTGTGPGGGETLVAGTYTPAYECLPDTKMFTP
ncbi:hypothetical protein GCM10022206_92720 [Streptomyces chiangmaiensis]